MPSILAGDLGGTKADLALFRVEDGQLQTVHEARLGTAGFAGGGALVSAFVRQLPEAPDLVCLGVAGPVRGDRVKPTNLPWELTVGEIAGAAGAESCLLVNDLVATAHGVRTLPRASLAVLQTGTAEPGGAVAVIAAGTGLGEAGLVWDGERYRAVPSEGGHADFAPADEEQCELLRFLRGKFGRVSVERVLSGPGLHNIYRFLVETGRCRAAPTLAERLEGRDPGAVIGELGVSGGDSTCASAVEIFCRVYGAAAGNLALTVLASGGVYLAGGIAPKLITVLRSGGFLETFTDKGRLRPLLEAIPLQVVLEPRVALHGAGRYAAEEAGWL